jgi:hypothetical protein
MLDNFEQTMPTCDFAHPESPTSEQREQLDQTGKNQGISEDSNRSASSSSSSLIEGGRPQRRCVFSARHLTSVETSSLSSTSVTSQLGENEVHCTKDNSLASNNRFLFGLK